MKALRSFLIAAGVAVGSVVVVNLAWTAIGGGPMSIHGIVALSLGVAGTIALAWVLMALAFKSDRDGWDDRADRTGSADVETPDKP
jgi:hypothetical protein